MYKWKEDTIQTGKPKTKSVLEAMIETAQEIRII